MIVKRGVELDLLIDRIADGGCGVGTADEKAVFVAHAVPGDRIRARILGRRKRRLMGEILEVLEPSPLRVEPRCKYFGSCGGCRRQNLLYTAQLDAKRQQVEDSFAEHGLLRDARVLPVLGSEKIFYYRNKMEFSFGARRWLTDKEVKTGEEYDRTFALGMHVPGHFDRLLDLSECHLQSELSSELVNGVRAFCRDQEWSPWSVRRQVGFLRHLVIRQPAHSEELMLNLVTQRYEPERMAALAAFLKERFSAVTTLVNTINPGVAQVATGDQVEVVFGTGLVHDRIGPYVFEIGPHSFFQTNTRQAERLYQVVAEYAAPSRDELLFDLYSGLGSIALFLSASVGRVIGFELEEEVVVAARRNAAQNGVGNAEFVAGDLARILDQDPIKRHGQPDVLVLDPPRAGIHPRALERILELGAGRIVYVSCNPASQARDLKKLANAYRIEAIQPVDLFPHTDHVENVVLLGAN